MDNREIEKKIWFTSDTHFGHQKEFLWAPRGFNSIEEHDEMIIHNWNEVVGPNDDVYHLGDVMLNDNEHGLECLKRLNGKIHITIGNHVWVGLECLILKGSIIANNSVIAARATVNKQFEQPGCIIAGAPAKQIKENINWDRNRI